MTSFPRRHSLSSITSDTVQYLKGHKTDDVCCCETSTVKECIYTASSEFIPLFLKGCLLKMFLELISRRSLKHLWNQLGFQVPRFGLVCGAVSSTFMLMMCILKRNTKMPRKKAMCIAAFVSSLPALIGMNAKEQQLFKLLIYPLMYRCLW
jgi:hypothetical protein